MPELWTEVCDIVQNAVIKTIPKKKKSKMAKWLSEEALQIAVERRQVKSTREKESYKHLNAVFQICWHTECSPFTASSHAKIGTIKDRNDMDLTEAEDTKKRWQEYTEELYKKDLHDPDNHKV